MRHLSAVMDARVCCASLQVVGKTKPAKAMNLAVIHPQVRVPTSYIVA